MVLRAQWPLGTITQFFHFVAEEKKDSQKTKAFYDWATTGITVKMCHKSSLEYNQLSPANLPRTVDVCGTEVNLDHLFESEGILTDSLQSKSILENYI